VLVERLGVSQQTLWNWRRPDQLDGHERDDGLTGEPLHAHWISVSFAKKAAARL